MTKYYAADFSISVVEIQAESKAQAEAVIHEFIKQITPVMANKMRWDEADWVIQEYLLDDAAGVWVEGASNE